DLTRLFDFSGTGTSTLTNLRLQNGGVTAPDTGAAIRTGTSLTLSGTVVASSVIQSNGVQGASGAGIAAGDQSDTLTLLNSVVSDNSINATTQNTGAGISSLADLVMTG